MERATISLGTSTVPGREVHQLRMIKEGGRLLRVSHLLLLWLGH